MWRKYHVMTVYFLSQLQRWMGMIQSAREWGGLSYGKVWTKFFTNSLGWNNSTTISICLFVSIYHWLLPVAHLSDAPRRWLVVTGDSSRIQDKTTEISTWFFNMGPRFKASSKRQLVIFRLTSLGIEPTTSSFQFSTNWAMGFDEQQFLSVEWGHL